MRGPTPEPPPRQELRAYRGDLDDDDEAAIQNQQANWRKRALKWLGRAGEKEEGPDRPTKRLRVKAFEWLNAVDQQLKQCSSFDLGFGSLKLPQNVGERGDPLSWPYLRISSDTGSDMVSGMFFLQYNGFAVEGIWDPIHGAHADFTRSLKHTRNYAFALLLLLVAWNLPYAPFDSGSRHNQILQSMNEYIDKHSQDCPLLDSLLDDILAEAGMQDRMHEDNIRDEVVEMLRRSSVLHRRGRKAGMTRFLGLLYSAEEEVKVWSLRLLGWLYYGLQAHLFTKESFTALVSKRQALVSSMEEEAAGEGAGMRVEDRAVANRLRSICSSGLQTAVLLYTDDLSKVRVQCFLQLGAPLKEFLGQCSQICRSTTECATWSQNLLCGGYFKHLLKLLQTLSDVEKLEAMGIRQRILEGVPAQAKHPYFMEQDEYADLVGTFAMTLLRFRLQRFIHLARGWPYRTCMFSVTNRDLVVQPILDQLKSDKEHDDKLAGMTSRIARSMHKRSLFRMCTVQQVFEICKASSFTLPLPPATRQWFERRARVPVTSLICEDALQRERLAEGGHRGGNRAVSRLHVWSTLVQRAVVSKVHRYRELPIIAGCEQRRQMPPDQFQQKLKTCTQELKKVVGTSQVTEWHSPSATNIGQIAVDLALMDFVERRGDWGLLENAWLSELGNGWPLLVRHRDETQWYFALGCVGGTMVLGWPAILKTIGEGSPGAFTIAAPNDQPNSVSRDATGIHFLCFAEVFKWKAMSFQFRSPSYWQCLASERNIQLTGGLGVAAEPHAPLGATPFWELACSCGAFCQRVDSPPDVGPTDGPSIIADGVLRKCSHSFSFPGSPPTGHPSSSPQAPQPAEIRACVAHGIGHRKNQLRSCTRSYVGMFWATDGHEAKPLRNHAVLFICLT